MNAVIPAHCSSSETVSAPEVRTNTAKSKHDDGDEKNEKIKFNDKI